MPELAARHWTGNPYDFIHVHVTACVHEICMILHASMHTIYMYTHVPNIHDIMHVHVHVHVRAKVGGGFFKS